MELVKLLKEPWIKSLASGTIPNMLKTAVINPIYMGGSRGLPKQYRPVALTSHIVKICEPVVRSIKKNF